VNTLSSDNKTERELERKRAGLSFLIVNLGVPWALRPNSPVLSRSCPKRVLFFFRRELPHRRFENDENIGLPRNVLQKIFQNKEDAMLPVTGFATVSQIANHCQISCYIIKFCYSWV